MKGIAYGLIWESEFPLPFPSAHADDRADIRLVFDANRAERVTGRQLVRRFTRTATGFNLSLDAADSHWAIYAWDQSNRVLTISTSRDASQTWPALVGLIPAILLRDLGHTLLHGAVVEIGGRAFGIVGPSGAGKSTLAAGLVRRGAQIVTDDLILTKAGSVVRGYTRIGLLPDAADGLGFGDGARDGIRLGDGKVQIRAQAEVGTTAPLAAIIALDPFDPTQAEPTLTRQPILQAVRTLRSNLYGDWIGPVTVADGAFCLALAQATPVYRLIRRANFAQIDTACGMIEAL